MTRIVIKVDGKQHVIECEGKTIIEKADEMRAEILKHQIQVQYDLMRPDCRSNEDAAWEAVAARDREADGRFVFGVATTGVYCRPSCPARRPRRANRSGAQRRPFTAAAQLVDKGGPLEAPPPNHRFEP